MQDGSVSDLYFGIQLDAPLSCGPERSPGGGLYDAAPPPGRRPISSASVYRRNAADAATCNQFGLPPLWPALQRNGDGGILF